MRGSREMFDINGEKLREEFKKRNLKAAQVEKECGFGQSVVNHYIAKNYISKLAKEMFAVKYNIPFEAYKVDEPKEEKKEVVEVVQHTTFSEEDWKQLYKVIYSATYEAMKHALAGE